MSAQALIPAFDPDSPDFEILAAFERIRAARAYTYGFDEALMSTENDAEIVGEIEAAIEAADKIMVEDEEQVHGKVANTLPGVAARLMLLIPDIDASRWIDRGLNGEAQQLVCAVRDLIRIEWGQALAAYERSVQDFSLALSLKGLVDAEQFRLRDEGQGASSFWERVNTLGEHMEAHFTNDAYVRRLILTLPPDIDAYRRKAQVVIAEGYQEEAAVWLVRDANYLAGRIDPRTFPQGRRA